MALDTEKTLKLLEDMRIPPAPFILDQLHQELQKDEPSITDISDIIAADVGMSALVLKTVNSPFFPLRVKVQSIQHATNLLGIDNTVNIVAGLALRRSFEESGAEKPPHFWDSPTNIAMAAADIAPQVSDLSSDEAYMLGLFHNAGHALMVNRFADYEQLLVAAINAPEETITAVEDRKYQTDHALVGFLLAKTWGLDRDVTEVILEHHNVLQRLRDKDWEASRKAMLLVVLKMAEHVDKLYWDMKPDYEWERIGPAILDYVGMSETDFEEMIADVLDKLVSG